MQVDAPAGRTFVLLERLSTAPQKLLSNFWGHDFVVAWCAGSCLPGHERGAFSARRKWTAFARENWSRQGS
jgi:hypothetical protein